MATKRDPGAFDCYKAALPDEPFFTLLARDPAAPDTLRVWAAERVRHKKTETPDDQDRIEIAYRDAEEMERWRAANLDPLGDGVATWRLPRQIEEDTAISIQQPVYIPAEQEGDAVTINKDWLANRVNALVEGDIGRKEFANLIGACLVAPSTYDPNAYQAALDAEKAAQDIPEPISSGFWDRSQPSHARPSIIDDAPDDLAHAPEVPPHRFSQFHKAGRYAYARGLEISPTHLPICLDQMAEDGWLLVSLFGQTDSKNVGFIFERRQPVVRDTLYDPDEDTFTWVSDIRVGDTIIGPIDERFETDILNDLGRGQEP